MENIYRLFQLFAYSSYYWRENILLSRWFESWFTVNGTDPSYYETYRCSRSGLTVWFTVVWPRQGDDGLGRERQRSIIHIWCRSCCKIPPQTWFGSYMSGTSSEFIYQFTLFPVLSWSCITGICIYILGFDE